jgi:hypothetical protein
VRVINTLKFKVVNESVKKTDRHDMVEKRLNRKASSMKARLYETA